MSSGDTTGQPAQGGHYFHTPAGDEAVEPFDVTLAGRPLRLVTQGGIFSAGRLDLGTRVLFRDAAAPPAGGNLLDLGCGWGPIALTLALTSPAARVWAVDVNERAVALTRRNAATAGAGNVEACGPDQVPDDVRFDAIWSNPPIRVGKVELHRMLTTWLPRLTEEGRAHLVVQRNLGADSLHRWLAENLPPDPERWSVTRAGSAKGYRVLQVARA